MLILFKLIDVDDDDDDDDEDNENDEDATSPDMPNETSVEINNKREISDDDEYWIAFRYTFSIVCKILVIIVIIIIKS